MMDGSLLDDTPNPITHVHEYAVDDFVSAAANGDEGHPTTDVVVSSFHNLNLDDSKGKALSLQKLKHEDFQILGGYV